jgi:ribosome-associated protein
MTTKPSKEPAAASLARFPREIQEAARAALAKKASHLVLLDLRSGSAFTDFFVICSAQNPRQVRAIVDAVEEQLRQVCGRRPAHVEGYGESEWVLLDYFEFVVHVFTPEQRAFYSLERLWGSAEHIDIADV